MGMFRYSGPRFAYAYDVRNDYDFEIVCETIRKNVQKNIDRTE